MNTSVVTQEVLSNLSRSSPYSKNSAFCLIHRKCSRTSGFCPKLECGQTPDRDGPQIWKSGPANPYILVTQRHIQDTRETDLIKLRWWHRSQINKGSSPFGFAQLIYELLSNWWHCLMISNTWPELPSDKCTMWTWHDHDHSSLLTALISFWFVTQLYVR